MPDQTRVVLLAGGFGGARMAHGFALLDDDVDLTVIVNTGDDLELHGLNISPDLDTVMYTLAGVANETTGWGVRDETWSAAEMLGTYGEPTWFRLGDRDLATHIARTARLRDSESLTRTTQALTSALGIKPRILPMTDDPVRTKVLTADGWLDFQDYFVRRGHRDEVREIRFEGIETAQPTAEVMQAITAADLIVIAPSNPFVSVAPILALPKVLDAMQATHAKVIAVSPIVGGRALRGPAAQMLTSLGGEATSAGIAAHYASRYAGLVDVLVVDSADSTDADAISRQGIVPCAASTIIDSDGQRQDLAREILDLKG